MKAQTALAVTGGAGVGVMLFCLAWLAVISGGELPRKTWHCDNGRIVYTQQGHDTDHMKFCAALEVQP